MYVNKHNIKKQKQKNKYSVQSTKRRYKYEKVKKQEINNIGIVMKKMMKTMITLCILFQLLSITNSYSIVGPWKLQIDDSYTNIDKSTSIVFDFKRDVENGAILHTLVVYACSLIQFRFDVEDNFVSFYVLGIGVKRNQCVKDQKSQIIKRLQKATFTVTIGNSLLFLSPSGKIILKLSSIQKQSSPTNLSGVWQVFQLLDQPSSIITRANNTVVQFCDGLATIDYNIPKSNILLTKVRTTKGCSQNDLLTSLYNAKFVRYFNSQQIWFYGQDGELLMKWRNLAEGGGDGPILFQSTLVRISNTANVSQDKSKIQSNIAINGNVTKSGDNLGPKQNITNKLENKAIPESELIVQVNLPENMSNTTISTPQLVSNILTNLVLLNATVVDKQEGASQPSQPVIQSPASSSQFQQFQTFPSFQPLVQNSTPSESNSTQVPPISPAISTNSISKKPILAQQQNSKLKQSTPLVLPKVLPEIRKDQGKYLEPLTKEKLLGKWYLTGTTNEVMAVITTNRVMIYGDCGVWFTILTFGQSEGDKFELKGNGAKNTTPSCVGKNNQIQSYLSKLGYVKVRQTSDKKQFLSLLDKDNNKLTEWSNTKQK